MVFLQGSTLNCRQSGNNNSQSWKGSSSHLVLRIQGSFKISRKQGGAPRLPRLAAASQGGPESIAPDRIMSLVSLAILGFIGVTSNNAALPSCRKVSFDRGNLASPGLPQPLVVNRTNEFRKKEREKERKKRKEGKKKNMRSRYRVR